MQCAAKAIEFDKITQNNGHYAVQGHSRSEVISMMNKVEYIFAISSTAFNRGCHLRRAAITFGISPHSCKDFKTEVRSIS